MGFITDPEAKITGRGGYVKSKRFWFFEGFGQSRGRRIAVRKRKMNLSAQHQMFTVTQSLRSTVCLHSSFITPYTGHLACQSPISTTTVALVFSRTEPSFPTSVRNLAFISHSLWRLFSTTGLLWFDMHSRDRISLLISFVYPIAIRTVWQGKIHRLTPIAYRVISILLKPECMMVALRAVKVVAKSGLGSGSAYKTIYRPFLSSGRLPSGFQEVPFRIVYIF